MKLLILASLLLGLSNVSGQPYATCGMIPRGPQDCANSDIYADSSMCCQDMVYGEGCEPCPTETPTTSTTTASPTTTTTAEPTTAEPTTAEPTPGPTTSEPICYCTTETPVTTVFSTPSPTTKSYAKKNKGSTTSGTSCGDCDCDKDYGVVELRFIYQGSAVNNNENVDIDIFDKSDLKICAFENIAVDEEFICTIEGNQGGSGKTDFDTETYIDIYDHAGGSIMYTGDSFHTSCSSDIVGLSLESYDDAILCSGWKDGNPIPNDCDDCQEECSCETETPATTRVTPSTTCYCATTEPETTIAATPSPTTKSYAKKTKGSSAGSGIGYGDCDCDKNYGVVELRFIYQGTASNNQGDVDINIFDKSDLLICAFNDVAVDDEIICTIEGNQGGSGKTDFDTETYIDIIDASSNSVLYTGDSFHTSCSSDIVGLTIYDDSIISSGWKDGNPIENDCDDGQEECDCVTLEPVTTTAGTTSTETTRYVEPTIPQDTTTSAGTTGSGTTSSSPDVTTTAEATAPVTTSDDVCYCDNYLCTATTMEPETTKKSKSKGKGGKSKGGKSKSKDGEGIGCGDCDCDKDYGMVELRVLYTGSEEVTIQWYDKSGDGQICVDSTGIAQGTEAICNVNDLLCSGDPCYEKLETNTFAKLVDSNGDEVCTTEIHTSCSRDIVGTSGEGDCGSMIVVTGWRDGNPNDDNNCDDGYDVCPCIEEDGSANEEANSISYIAGQLVDNDYAAYVEQQANAGSNTDGSSAGNSFKTNLCAFICAFVIIKLF